MPFPRSSVVAWLVLILQASGLDEDGGSRRLQALLFSAGSSDKSTGSSSSSSSSKVEPCAKFGGQFDVPLQGTNVVLDCPSVSTGAAKRVCCAAHFPTQLQAVSNGTYVKSPGVGGAVSSSTRGVGWAYEPKPPAQGEAEGASRTAGRGKEGAVTCTMTKKYHSSPQELRELAAAEQISRLGTASLVNPAPLDSGTKLPLDVHNARLDALLEFVTLKDSVTNATRWLARVNHHMQSADPRDVGTDDDYELLSRFEVTKTCSGGETVSWVEWIEPLTVTARHPFGLSSCRPAAPTYSKSANAAVRKLKVGRSNVDYVLLQSGKHVHDGAFGGGGGRGRQGRRGKGRGRGEEPTRHVLLDAGTSTFDSSLYWFTCGYSQRGVSFDSVHAWEMTLLHPQDYWRRVPAGWKPYWHFYNTPIRADPTHGDSPARLLRQMVGERDFVAFKLDIDHPDTEMPIALSLLGGLGQLVDEFFFELHFRDEVMTSCGWGKRVPAESHGLRLDRPSVLKFFRDLREKGIRAHIWP